MSAFNRTFLQCRDMGHAWDQIGDVIRQRTESRITFTRSLRCARCGTERRDEYRIDSNTVQKRKAGYTYPNGYQVRGGMTRGDARLIMWEPGVEMDRERFEARRTA